MSSGSYGGGSYHGRRPAGMAPQQPHQLHQQHQQQQQQHHHQQQQQQYDQEARDSSAGPSSADYGSGGERLSDSKSPLQLGLGFLRGIGDKRNKGVIYYLISIMVLAQRVICH